MTDILAPILVLIASASIVLGWVHFSSQTNVHRSKRNSAVILARLSAVIALCYLVVCVWFKVPVHHFACGSFVVLAISPVATREGVDASDAIVFALANTIAFPVYLLKQFVLGFPDREVLVSVPESEEGQSSGSLLPDPPYGTVLTVLKPCGTVEINGLVYPAVTAEGKYADSGTSIRATAARNDQLIVEVVETEKSVPA